MKVIIAKETLSQSSSQPIGRKKPLNHRSRDALGRFSAEESRSSYEVRPRELKLVKVSGSYGSYVVKTRWLTDEQWAIFIIISLTVLYLTLTK
ncbi:hypothetical protein [Shouchella hunanensis]|uniref:Uncharacterized protein n=1 Tax=Shouchella hunanensis TaxID=766894 RepID=A0ABY7W5I2_9BACI|nr:hypothetical protein [Shouchella hunanensis]WDF02756.1 hypothetical protein PQ477_14770 [Shouchella hunanensis]